MLRAGLPEPRSVGQRVGYLRFRLEQAFGQPKLASLWQTGASLEQGDLTALVEP